jgi:putative NADH-flavin reductase
MTATGRRRLLCVTGAMVGAALSRSRALSWMATLYRWWQPAVARDREEQEEAVTGSGLDWTLFKPPRLTDGDPTRRVAAGPELPVGLFSAISRADLADFMLDAVLDPGYIRQRLIVKQGS